MLGIKDFKEDVDVDIYAPFDSKIDKNNFKIKVKDYSYFVKNNKLSVYIVLQFDGIIKDTNNNNQSLIEEINNLNEINDEKTSLREEVLEVEEKEDVKIMEQIKDVKEEKFNIVENKEKDKVSNNWSKDLFKLNDSYAIFHKFKLK